MTTLVHAALTLRRTARASAGPAFALVFLALPLLGVFADERFGVEHAVLAAGWLVLLAVRGHRRVSLGATSRGELSSARAREVGALDLELGSLAIAGAHGFVQHLGGLAGPAHPVVYVVVALASSFATRPAATVLVALSVAYESAVWRLVEPGVPAREVGLHALFMVCFGALNAVLTHAELARMRARSDEEREAEKARLEQDVRLFRLVGAPSAEAAEGGEDKVFRSSVDEVKDSLFHVLDLLKRTLELHTCVLLLATPERKLRIAELVTDSEEIAEGPFEVGAGAVGGAASRGLVMNLEHLKAGYKGLCYYRGAAPVRAFLAVPVVERGQLVGALCADRLEDRAFSPRDEEALQSAVRQALRALENERIFVQLERTKREQGMLFRASQELGAALTEEQVVEAGLGAAGRIARFDFASITSWDAARRVHTVRTAVGVGAEAVAGLSFRDNASLTAMVVKNRHHLPYRGEYDAAQQVLYTSKVSLPEMRSVLVLPLSVREDVLGTVALAARRPGAFGDAVRPTLQALANQLAVALSNARAVKRLEEMATTDGLTGCLNKRAFTEELEAKIRSAERFKKKFSLVVADIDHFKSVNDTYGHAIGDVVIKELGQILLRRKRETDRVARFGGEEFCVICEETDTDGAVLFAERVREELSKVVFPTELGKLKVTLSLGVATFPKDAGARESLFVAADKALYAAKHGGRNRVCTTKDC